MSKTAAAILKDGELLLLSSVTKACHDCHTQEGGLHAWGCDMERCPFCGKQLASCSCKYHALGYEYDRDKEFCGLPEDVYKNGLPKEQDDEWRSICEKEGRRVWFYIMSGARCQRCGNRIYDDAGAIGDEEVAVALRSELAPYLEDTIRKMIICDSCCAEMLSRVRSYKKE
jgi:hypothetical protein